MTTDTQQALKHEAEFLSGVGANFEAAKGRKFRGSIWQRSQTDDNDRLRALMASHRNYDKARLKSLPANRRVTVRGFERRMLFWKRPTGVAIASVLSPLEHYASGAEGKAPPISLGELMDHVRRLASEQKVQHVIGVCSPTGFTDEARDAPLDMPNATVVLIEPGEQGGWKTTAGGEDVEDWVLELFDPEGAKGKIERVERLVEERSADLLTGGVTASSVAAKAGLPEHLVRRGFEQVAAADPELRLTRKAGELLLFRGASVHRQEKTTMNVIDRIRQLFSGEGDEAEKINLLAERRATLAQRRDRIYEDIGKLEHKEADLLTQGKAAKSSVPRRRLAAQLAQMRKDIARQNTTAAMLNKQIDIISTDIHNLTLIRQGEAAKLPDTTELTEHAVEAEEMLETLRSDADLVSGLETGIEETLASDEELAILKEFEETDAAPAEAQTAAPSRTTAAADETGSRRSETASSREPIAEEPPLDKQDTKSRDADPEPT
ncbi:MAG: hypothetical protein IIB60_02575 [Planctomycetes bacterium]|nr:hypothetical protein [Planctomycetota bacterium]